MGFSYNVAMAADLVEHWENLLHATLLGAIPWLQWFVFSIIDFLTSPFTGIRTRSYWPELVASLIIAAALYIVRSQPGDCSLRGLWRYWFPSAMWRHKSTWVDFQIIVLNNFFANSFMVTWRFNAALMTTTFLAVLVHVFGPAPHFLAWTPVMLVLYTILVAMADDLGYFIFHLASHRIGWLWAFHKVHHSAETLTVLANVRTHPVEYAITEPCKAITTSLVLAPAIYLGTGHATLVDVLGMNLMAAFYCVLGTQLHHSHVWLSWGKVLSHVLISPAQHQIHHSSAPRHWNRNMGGNFAFWDWICGTLYVPEGHEEISFGLGAGQPQPYGNALLAYALPFWEITPEAIRQRIRRLLRGKLALSARVQERPMATQPPS